MNDEVQLKTKKKEFRFQLLGPKSTALLKGRMSRYEGDGVGGILIDPYLKKFRG